MTWNNERSQASATVYEALASAFAAPATAQVVANVQDVLTPLGAKLTASEVPQLSDEEHFCLRFVLPNSPLFVPLAEAAVRSTEIVGGTAVYRNRYLPETGRLPLAYEAAGFQVDALGVSGADARWEPLAHRADGLVCELAFMAFLRSRERHNDADNFARSHLLRWVDHAANLLSLKSDDAYARLAGVTAAWVRLDLEL